MEECPVALLDSTEPTSHSKRKRGKFSPIDLTVTKGHWQVSDCRGDEACTGTASSIIVITMSKAGAEPPSKPLCIFVE